MSRRTKRKRDRKRNRVTKSEKVWQWKEERNGESDRQLETEIEHKFKKFWKRKSQTQRDTQS